MQFLHLLQRVSSLRFPVSDSADIFFVLGLCKGDRASGQIPDQANESGTG